jgi:hypothetical protein
MIPIMDHVWNTPNSPCLKANDREPGYDKDSRQNRSLAFRRRLRRYGQDITERRGRLSMLMRVYCYLMMDIPSYSRIILPPVAPDQTPQSGHILTGDSYELRAKKNSPRPVAWIH